MPRPEWVEVGRVARPHGVRGEVRIASSSDNPDRFVVGAVVHARPGRSGLAKATRAGKQAPAERTTLKIEDVRGTWDLPIVAFEGIEDRDQAEAVRGWILEVPSSELPDLEEGEYYPCDLEGLEVRTPDGTRVGVVTQWIETPAHDVLALRLDDDGREVLVPFVEEAVPEVDVPGGRLVVELPFLLPAVDE